MCDKDGKFKAVSVFNGIALLTIFVDRPYWPFNSDEKYMSTFIHENTDVSVSLCSFRLLSFNENLQKQKHEMFMRSWFFLVVPSCYHKTQNIAFDRLKGS